MGYDRFATSMSITLENAIAELRQAIPSFTVDPEYGAEGLSYLVFSDFARFICSEAEVLKYVESDEEALRLSMVPACMAFLERVVEEGDSEVHELVDDCVESLSACQWQEQIRVWTKPNIAAIWKRYL